MKTKRNSIKLKFHLNKRKTSSQVRSNVDDAESIFVDELPVFVHIQQSDTYEDLTQSTNEDADDTESPTINNIPNVGQIQFINQSLNLSQCDDATSNSTSHNSFNDMKPILDPCFPYDEEPDSLFSDLYSSCSSDPLSDPFSDKVGYALMFEDDNANHSGDQAIDRSQQSPPENTNHQKKSISRKKLEKLTEDHVHLLHLLHLLQKSYLDYNKVSAACNQLAILLNNVFKFPVIEPHWKKHFENVSEYANISSIVDEFLKDIVLQFNAENRSKIERFESEIGLSSHVTLIQLAFLHAQRYLKLEVGFKKFLEECASDTMPPEEAHLKASHNLFQNIHKIRRAGSRVNHKITTNLEKKVISSSEIHLEDMFRNFFLCNFFKSMSQSSAKLCKIHICIGCQGLFVRNENTNRSDGPLTNIRKHNLECCGGILYSKKKRESGNDFKLNSPALERYSLPSTLPLSLS